MRPYLSKVRHTLRHEGLISVLARSARYLAYRARRTAVSKGECIREWADLKGRYEGRRAFLIGNGPSLNLTELYLLGDEVTMCFNRFDLMLDRLAWNPTFYMVIDDRVLLDTMHEVRRMSRLAQHSFFPDIHPYNVDFRPLIEKRPDVHWLYLDRANFSMDLPYCGINKSVANVGLQVLGFLGFREIYLLGVDMSYALPPSVIVENVRDVTATEDDDENHFDPRYFGANRKYHVPMLDETLMKFEEARDFFGAAGVSIQNATVGGNLEVFERVDLTRVLGLSIEDRAERFRTTVLSHLLRPNMDPLELIREGPLVRRCSDVSDDLTAFRANADDSATLIKRLVFRYVPFGPFRGQHLYISRDLCTGGTADV